MINSLSPCPRPGTTYLQAIKCIYCLSSKIGIFSFADKTSELHSLHFYYCNQHLLSSFLRFVSFFLLLRLHNFYGNRLGPRGIRSRLTQRSFSSCALFSYLSSVFSLLIVLLCVGLGVYKGLFLSLARFCLHRPIHGSQSLSSLEASVIPPLGPTSGPVYWLLPLPTSLPGWLLLVLKSQPRCYHPRYVFSNLCSSTTATPFFNFLHRTNLYLKLSYLFM